jgi:hypothetical protein
MKVEANCHGLESCLDLELVDGYVRVRWHIRRLGEPFPGGDWLVKDPAVEFHAVDRPPVRVELISVGHPDKTVVGLRSFRRMRELAMPSEPWSYAVSLSAATYRVLFRADVYDCRRLTYYCDAMQIFAGHFSEMVAAFEDHRQMWQERGHAEAGEPYRFPCELDLGELRVPEGHTHAPTYYPINEVSLRRVDWTDAPARKVLPPPSSSPPQPELLLARQIASGVQSLRTHGFCRWGTHCNQNPVPPGSYWMGGSDRLYAMWGSTFEMQYLLTGDPETGAAAWYCVRDCLQMAERDCEPHHKHCLSFGMASMMMVRFARIADRPDLIEPLARIWRKWPYDRHRHNMATQPNAEGGDHTPNDTYNMKAVGAAAMWLVGRYLNDLDLMEKGEDCVMRFVLPAMQPEGYWYYRPGSPEGAIVRGIQRNNHYDGFVKSLLARLLFHPEWREKKDVMDAVRRGVDFTLQHLTAQDGRTLTFELHPDARFPPREELARYLGHAGMYAEPLSLLAIYENSTYLEPLRKSMQFVFDHREDAILADYWDNAWLYGLYVGALNLSRLGFQFRGTPENLALHPPSSVPEPIP